MAASKNLSWGRNTGPVPNGGKNWTYDKRINHQSDLKLSINSLEDVWGRQEDCSQGDQLRGCCTTLREQWCEPRQRHGGGGEAWIHGVGASGLCDQLGLHGLREATSVDQNENKLYVSGFCD